jgi:hypothetical protein
MSCAQCLHPARPMAAPHGLIAWQLTPRAHSRMRRGGLHTGGPHPHATHTRGNRQPTAHTHTSTQAHTHTQRCARSARSRCNCTHTHTGTHTQHPQHTRGGHSTLVLIIAYWRPFLRDDKQPNKQQLRRLARRAIPAPPPPKPPAKRGGPGPATRAPPSLLWGPLAEARPRQACWAPRNGRNTVHAHTHAQTGRGDATGSDATGRRTRAQDKFCV